MEFWCSEGHLIAWWTFRIFFLFSCSGRGWGSLRRHRGGDRFVTEIPGGGGFQEGGGGAGRVSAANWGIFLGGGGAKYFFSGPKRPPSLAQFDLILTPFRPIPTISNHFCWADLTYFHLFRPISFHNKAPWGGTPKIAICDVGALRLPKIWHPRRGRSKRGRARKHANEHKKSANANERKRPRGPRD